MLWHEGVARRNDEDIASCFEKIMLHKGDRDTKHLVLEMDNCRPQNKNWTLYPALVGMLNNSCTSLETITLKYFDAGHTYMSADSFHHLVEKEAKKMYNLYDFQDFLKCVSNVGTAVNMNPEDFHKWEKQLSEGKNSKAAGPLLEKFVEAQFRSGSTDLFFKESHAQEDFKQADFLKTKFKKLVEDHAVSPQVSTFPGINEQRKKAIIDNLLHLMPENRRSFWINLQFSQQD